MTGPGRSLAGGLGVLARDPSPVDPLRFRDGPAFRRGDSIPELLLERARRREADAGALAAMIRWILDQGLSRADEDSTIRAVCQLMLLEFESQAVEISGLVHDKARMIATAGRSRSGEKARAFFEAVLPLIRGKGLALDNAARIVAARAAEPTTTSGKRRAKPLSWSRVRDLVLEERRRRVQAKATELLAEGYSQEDAATLIEAWAANDPSVFPVSRKIALGDIRARTRKK